jgi:hypothetical protein
MPAVEAAMERRFKRLKAALSDDESMGRFRGAWHTIFTHRLQRTEAAIRRNGKPGRDDGRFWRWHDSGDIHGMDHLILLVNLAVTHRKVGFWLPTKEIVVVQDFVLGRPRGYLPPNLKVRLSVPRFNASAPMAYHRLKAAAPDSNAFAAAHTKGGPPEGFERCIAPSQDGHCADCRSCWTGKSVSYAVHTARRIEG